MRRRIGSRLAQAAVVCSLTLAASLCGHLAAFAEAIPNGVDPAPYPPQFDHRTNGVLAESYAYHRHDAPYAHTAPPNIAPADGWYGYGFPVQTYRWGWFGAQRYYPRVVWHRGYYGDCCRWAYRHGY